MGRGNYCIGKVQEHRGAGPPALYVASRLNLQFGIPSRMRKSAHRLRDFLETHQKKGEEARATPPLWGSIGSEQVMGEG